MQRIATAPNAQPPRPQAQLFSLDDLGGVAFLGNPTNLSSPPENTGLPGDFELTKTPVNALLAFKDELVYPTTPADARIERYANLATARDILPKSRTAFCMHAVRQGATSVPIQFSKKAGRASYRNLQVCGSVWRCAVCAAKISEKRRTALHRATGSFKARTGGVVLLSTRTFPHSAADTVADLMEGLKKAEKQYKSGKQWKAISEEFGLVGTVRNVEITFGIHGAHPHIHELLFLSGPVDMEALQEALYLKWAKACQRAGLGTPTRAHGLDIRNGDKAEAYIAKMGLEELGKRQWTTADELTKSHMKKGRGQSLSPFDLLRVARQATDKRVAGLARKYFRDYAEAFHNKRQLVVSPGLKPYFEEEDDRTDEELAQETDPDASTLAVLTLAGWKEVLRQKVRGQLLEVASRNDAALVRRYLLSLCPNREASELFLVHTATWDGKPDEWAREAEEPGTAGLAAQWEGAAV